MTGILDRIKNTTVADLANVSGSFDDVPAPVYRPRVPREMIREVEGATDLRDAMLNAGRPSRNAGMVVLDGSGPVDNRPFKDDQRTDGQIRYMDILIEWITEKDATLGRAARDWTDKATASGVYWTPGREGTVSMWINKLKAKNDELKAAEKAKPAPVATKDDYDGIPVGYYALTADGITKFYRVTRSDAGRTYLRIQASDEFHLIRNGGTKAMILNAIRADLLGAAQLYGQLIGRCGRCHRTLTDELSRSRGIGPDCWEKM